MCETQHDAPEFVRVQGHDVFFYCAVDEASILELVTALKKVEHELFSGLLRLGLWETVPTIHLHIKSEGGDLYAGLAAFDFVRSMRAYVHTHAEGCVASAATLVFLGGDQRTVHPNAYILIHQISHELWGKFEELKDDMDQCQRLMKHLKRIYLRETTIPEKKLESLLQRDIYLNARKCRKYTIG
jgi:ATP-dependent protease ClpP protease subunit